MTALCRVQVSGPKHGYAIMADITEFSVVMMEPGTLYGALARLERQGWVEAVAVEDRRRPYRITGVGQTVLSQQIASMRAIARVGRRRIAPA